MGTSRVSPQILLIHHMSNQLWKFLTSLKLTVVLLVLCTILVFLGTIAQVHDGLWLGQERWFKSYLVFWSKTDPMWFPPIFPGGYTLGFALLINLIAAHLKRFHFSVKKVGIHLTHLGIILLLGGQLATDLGSKETFMSFAEGEKRDYSEAHRAVELVVTYPVPENPQQSRVIPFEQSELEKRKTLTDPEMTFSVQVLEYGENADVIPHESIKEAGARLVTALATLEANYATTEGMLGQLATASQNPGRLNVWTAALQAIGEKDRNFEAAVKRVASDSKRADAFREDLKKRFRAQMLDAFQKAPPRQGSGSQSLAMAYVARETLAGRKLELENIPAAAEQGTGLQMTLAKKPPVRGMEEQNYPWAKVKLVAKDGKSLGTWLLSALLYPQDVQVGEKKYQIMIRSEQHRHPFSLTLLKTTHEVYQGTEIPKNFQSRVQIHNPKTGEHRDVDISMNNPLRYGGLTFFQSQMGRTAPEGGKGTSVLQVVKNPAWITPYLGCFLVGLGMTWQFLYHLIGFLMKLGKRKDAASTALV